MEGGAGGVSSLRFAIHFIFEDTGIEILVVHHVLETLSNICVVEHVLVLGTIINARSWLCKCSLAVPVGLQACGSLELWALGSV